MTLGLSRLYSSLMYSHGEVVNVRDLAAVVLRSLYEHRSGGLACVKRARKIAEKLLHEAYRAEERGLAKKREQKKRLLKQIALAREITLLISMLTPPEEYPRRLPQDDLHLHERLSKIIASLSRDLFALDVESTSGEMSGRNDPPPASPV